MIIVWNKNCTFSKPFNLTRGDISWKVWWKYHFFVPNKDFINKWTIVYFEWNCPPWNSQQNPHGRFFFLWKSARPIIMMGYTSTWTQSPLLLFLCIIVASGGDFFWIISWIIFPLVSSCEDNALFLSEVHC